MFSFYESCCLVSGRFTVYFLSYVFPHHSHKIVERQRVDVAYSKIERKIPWLEQAKHVQTCLILSDISLSTRSCYTRVTSWSAEIFEKYLLV